MPPVALLCTSCTYMGTDDARLPAPPVILTSMAPPSVTILRSCDRPMSRPLTSKRATSGALPPSVSPLG